MGTDLWHIDYDEPLCLEMPDDAYLVSYTDNVAAFITVHNAELPQLKLDLIRYRIGARIESHGLDFALGETEIVISTWKRMPTVIPMRVSPQQIRTQCSA